MKNKSSAAALMTGAEKSFRPDVQGLRAVAVGVVLLYHAGAPFLPGGFVGVDVFFVISGFLITGMLLKEALRDGQISLPDFYARRMRRILPAATIVLVATAVATATILPRTRWDGIGHDIVGSAFYYANWIFAANVNYLNADVPPSPLQHFWTLAVEEQFYIIWPLLLIGILALARPISRHSDRLWSRRRTNPPRVRRFAQIAALLITVPSLVWSVYYTLVEPAPAYFVTPTRLWELGIGACIAVFATQLQRIGIIVGHTICALGLFAIIGASAFYSTSTPFPGWAALLPALGAAGILIGGMGGRATRGIGALLSVRPMRSVGDMSYSLYLWHWPMIVFGTFLLGDELAFWQGLVIVGVAIIPSWFSYRFVEMPSRDWAFLKGSNLNTFSFSAGLAVISLIAGLAVMLPVAFSSWSTSNAPSAAQISGAELLIKDPRTGAPLDVVDHYTPTTVDAADDNPPVYSDGCHQETQETEFVACSYGSLDSDYTVAVVGDSHAAQWVPALILLAEQNQWRLDSYTKSECPLISTEVRFDGGPYTACTAWNRNALAHLTGADQPDFVLLGSASYVATEGSPSIVDGYQKAWATLETAGVPFAMILDTPRPAIDIPECVASNETNLTECAVRREDARDNGMENQEKATDEAGITPVDLFDLICPEDRCAPIIGNVLVYRDTNHLTATYAESLAPSLGRALREVAPELRQSE